MCVCVRACVFVRMCVRAYVCDHALPRVCVGVRIRACVCAYYEIMIAVYISVFVSVGSDDLCGSFFSSCPFVET